MGKITDALEKHRKLFPESKLTYAGMTGRIKKLGLEDAIKNEFGQHKKKSIRVMCEEVGCKLSPMTVRSRMKKGMSFEEAIAMPLQRRRRWINED